MNIRYLPMTMADYDEVVALWQEAPGIGLSSADGPEAIDIYLQRNPEMSITARDGDILVGAVLCGHDGRRGFIHHLAVAQSHYQRGIGKILINRCLDLLAGQGIEKAHIFVYGDNRQAIGFWERIGWSKRHELIIMSHDIQVRK